MHRYATTDSRERKITLMEGEGNPLNIKIKDKQDEKANKQQ